MCVISKLIGYQELKTIAIVVFLLLSTTVNDEITEKDSNRTGTTAIKRQYAEEEDVFDYLVVMHLKRTYIEYVRFIVETL